MARAGRFGTKGLAITFVSDENDAKILNEVQDRFEVNISELPDEIDISSYSELQQCGIHGCRGEEWMPGKGGLELESQAGGGDSWLSKQDCLQLWGVCNAHCGGGGKRQIGCWPSGKRYLRKWEEGTLCKKA